MVLKYKMKGAYFFPDPLNYSKSISEMQPPGWHRDWSNMASVKAAFYAMTANIDVEFFLSIHMDVFDFMLRVKVGRADELLHGGQPVQKTSRYYVAKNGAPLVKISPPAKGAQVGGYRRANKIPEPLWQQVNAELAAQGRPNDWDQRIHTKNKSRYEMRETGIEAGYNVALCNDVNDFRFDNIDMSYYINEAKKLII